MATQNNVHTPDEMLTAVTDVARAGGKIVDELTTETPHKMLRVGVYDRSLRRIVGWWSNSGLLKLMCRAS